MGVNGKFIEVPDATHNVGIFGTDIFDRVLLPLLQ
jgi:hypothetical protein